MDRIHTTEISDTVVYWNIPRLEQSVNKNQPKLNECEEPSCNKV